MIIGPITQPKLVGQQPMSHGRTSKCAQVSDAHLMGESCVHGIAFGSPSQEKKKEQKISNVNLKYRASRKGKRKTVLGHTSCS